eukprot:TRINITY_DN8905_c0_g1_i1.p1 TRINITY_DN8905_c0_g1~~TRINITY_DN8905_c0_g1_i1.p1  ORF type:complete len:493 (+),score=96.24 TRINITY_DN8905_c0_g1_i1:95-1573(+)
MSGGDETVIESKPGGSTPLLVNQFITYFFRHVREKSVLEIHSMYENSFNKVTDKYYKQSSWPSLNQISHLIGPEPFFALLYKELYYRHLYAKLIPTLEQRVESWNNYHQLFTQLLGSNPPNVELPAQWLWDIIAEFIYQFQSFCQFKPKLKNKSKEEVQSLENNPDAWSAVKVITFLEGFVSKMKSPVTVLKELGYFSVIGLCRVHCLLGDYHLALKTLAPIEIDAHKGLFTQVVSCHISLYYYMGFVYMMMRRYSDAVRTFSSVLLYISRTKQYHSRSYQFDQISKKNDQMYGLLAICLSLGPQRVDENVNTLLREKHGDKMIKMQRGDEAAFEELFNYACPKFVNPAQFSLSQLLEGTNATDAMKVQSRLFLQEVRQQLLVPTIRSYLKLYTTITTQKLSNFLDLDEETFTTQLLCFKHKTRGVSWTGGQPLNGEWAPTSDVDFYLNQDMVHITDTKVQRKYSEFFLRHIHKFDEIIVDVSKDQSNAQGH